MWEVLYKKEPVIRKQAAKKHYSEEYQPSGEGGTRSLPASPHRLQHNTTCLIPNCRQVFGRSRQLSLNKFFDPTTPSMRKGCDGEKRKENTSLAAPGALAHRLQRRNACNAAPPAKSKMAARGPQNGRWGLESCPPLGFWAF